MTAPFTTHEVTNQPPLFEDINLFSSDRALVETVEREGGGSAAKRLNALGLVTGSREAFDRGRLANENPPKLKTHDAQGRRIDVVEFHPSYHTLMEASFSEGLHSSVWSHLGAKGGARDGGIHVVRAAGVYMSAQMEAGHGCPISMTNGKSVV